MAVFEKKSGAPSGLIKINIGGRTYTIDDGGTITENDYALASELRNHAFLTLQGADDGYAPPIYYRPVEMVQSTPAIGSVLTQTVNGWEAKPPPSGGGTGTSDPVVVFQGSNSASIDDRAALQAAINQAISTQSALYIPAGKHRIDGAVHWPQQQCRIFGAGCNISILNFNSGTTYAAFKIGPDSSGGPGVGPGDWATGYVQDFSIWANNAPDSVGNDSPTGGYGLQISQSHPDVIRMDVRGFNVAFDLTGNCYGTRFASCWAKYGWNNYGLLLREGDQSGQDITFDNCWFSGRKGGVVIAGWGAGYHFRGGQISGGTSLPSTQEWRGALLLGPAWSPADPNLGACGSSRNMTFTGVNFEGTHGMWHIRAFQPQRGLLFQGCHFMGAASDLEANSPIGVFKADDFFNGTIDFRSCTVHRYYQGVSDTAGDSVNGTKLVALKGALAGYPDEPLIIEDGTAVQDCRGANPIQNLETLYAGVSMFSHAHIYNHGRQRAGQQQLGPIRIAGNPDGHLYRSGDWGQTWVQV